MPQSRLQQQAMDAAGDDLGAAQRRQRWRLQWWLYLICALTDFAVFLVIFTASRMLADRRVEPWYLGMIGAGLSFASGIGSLAGGWLASHWNGRAVFVLGALGMAGSILACLRIDPGVPVFLVGYSLMGVSVGFIYPPLVGWLNQGETAEAHHATVSLRLIYFCVAWNFGMMCGQLSGGELLLWGPHWTLGAAFWAAVANVIAVLLVVWLVARIPAATGPSAGEKPNGTTALAPLFKRLGWIANLGGVFGGSIVIHLLPDLIVSLKIPADAHGRLLAGWRVVIIATYLVMHFVGFWHYRLGVSLASQVLGAGGLFVIARADSPLQLMVGLALLGQLVGFNYFSGLYYSTAGSSQKTRALAAGIHEATLAAGMALGTIAGGVLGSLIDHRLPYAIATVIILLLIGVQGLAWRRWRPAANSKDEF